MALRPATNNVHTHHCFRDPGQQRGRCQPRPPPPRICPMCPGRILLLSPNVTPSPGGCSQEPQTFPLTRPPLHATWSTGSWDFLTRGPVGVKLARRRPARPGDDTELGIGWDRGRAAHTPAKALGTSESPFCTGPKLGNVSVGTTTQRHVSYGS